MAERSTFSISVATDFFVKRSTASASEALRPRIRSITRPAFWADVRTYLAVALTSNIASPSGLGRWTGDLGHLLHLRGVALELARRGELPQLVAHHVLGDVDRDELLAVVDGNGVPHHFRHDGGTPGPGLQHLAVPRRVHLLDALQQMIVDEGPLLERSCHFYLRLFTMNLLVRLLFRVLAPLVGLPHGVTGCLPPEVFPSPPPCAWSPGFMTTPLVWGFLPSQRFRPAFPSEMFLWSRLPTWPTVARHST